MSQEATPPDSRGGANRRRLVAIAVLLLVVVALALRLRGLGERVLSHPENFAPGIEVPTWVDTPPERSTLRDVLRVTVFYDGHPPGYFVAMHAWVQAFGASLLSLRLPSALLGAASVALLFLLGRKERGVAAALLAAALLSTHGFHLYWSQKARMYAPVAFLGLLSTLALYRCVERGRRRDGVAYFLATVAGLWTQLYAWPLLAGQMAWIALGSLGGARRVALLRVQALALVAGAPTLQLAAFQNPVTRWHEPVRDYFGLGFLFDTALPFWDGRPWSPGEPVLLIFGLLVLGAGVVALLRAPRVEAAVPDEPAMSWAHRMRAADWVLAAFVSGLLLLFARTWLGGWRAVTAAAAFPFLALAGHRLLERALALADRRALVPEHLRATLRALPQSLVLALLPVGIMAALSAFRGTFTARGTLVFLPYLLLLAGVGVEAALRHRRAALRLAGAATLGVLVLLFVSSVRYARRSHGSERDYASVAAALDRTRPNDLILVRNTWVFAPLYYYVDRSLEPRLVYRNEGAAIAAAAPGTDLWMVRFTDEGLRPEVDATLSSWHVRERHHFVGAEVRRYTRDPEGPGQPPLGSASE